MKRKQRYTRNLFWNSPLFWSGLLLAVFFLFVMLNGPRQREIDTKSNRLIPRLKDSKRTFSANKALQKPWILEMPLPAVHAILPAPDGLIWAATENGIAYIKNDKLIQLSPQNGGFPVQPASALAYDGKNIWIGTFYGLFRTDNGFTFERFDKTDGIASDMIWSLKWDGTVLWIGTQNGLSYRLPNGTFETITEDISPNKIAGKWIGAIERWKHLLLCGTDKGLMIWDLRLPASNNAAWQLVDMFKSELPHDWIFSMVYANGELKTAGPWGIGILKTPLEQLFKGVKPEWEIPSKTSAFPSKRIDVLLQVENDLWGGSPEGLFCLKNGVVKVFTTADGLLASEVTALAEASGTLWVGTSGGLQSLSIDECGF